MVNSKKLQSEIEDDLICDAEPLYKLSYDFKKKLLKEKNWVKIGETDGFNDEIFKNENINSTYCIISKGRRFCFVTNPYTNNNNYWFRSEVIFETILNNLTFEEDNDDWDSVYID